jgi:hypothetical protein
VAEWIAAHDPDFTIHLGDIVYWPVHLREAHEEAFFRPFAPVLAKAALYTSIGNHDIPRDGSPPPFDSLFQRPASSAPGRSYAFAWGAVRVFVLDNIAEGWAAGGPAHRWLDAELRAAAEPWLVVAMHRPHFTTCREGAEPQRGEPWSLLERHGVDLVISGDDHLYQRFVPPAGPVQIVAGAGGKSLYDCSRDHPQLAAMAVEWSAVIVDARGPVLETRAVGAGGAILDEHRIDRARGPLPAEIGAARRARILALRRGPPAPSAARLRD